MLQSVCLYCFVHIKDLILCDTRLYLNLFIEQSDSSSQAEVNRNKKSHQIKLTDINRKESFFTLIEQKFSDPVNI